MKQFDIIISSRNNKVNVFSEKFQNLFNKNTSLKAWDNNIDVILPFAQFLYDLEVKGIKNGASIEYFDAYNQAFVAGLNKACSIDNKLTQRGFNIFIRSLSSAVNSYKDDKNKLYNINQVNNTVTQAFKKIFENVTSTEIDYYKSIDTSRALNINSIIHRTDIMQNMTTQMQVLASVYNNIDFNMTDDSKYLSYPVYGHLSDPEQQQNINIMINAIIKRFGVAGGGSFLFDAGVGMGKTHLVAKILAPILSRICHTSVSMLTPTTPQVSQAHEKYGADTNYGATKQDECYRSDKYECVIYDKADDIKTVTSDGKPVIVFVDEAHEIITDAKFRKKAIIGINKKIKEILSAGGCVITMTASSDIVAATMPYNNITGYDGIFHAFKVSSKDPVNGIIYPLYSYINLKATKSTDIHSVSSVNADNLDIIYNKKGNKIEDVTLTYIRNLIQEGYFPLVKLDDKDVLSQIKNQLDLQGYPVDVVNADEKDYDYNESEHRRQYRNKTYNAIINNGSIDVRDIKAILTTKLLENGTSIDNIVTNLTGEEKEKRKYKVITVYVCKNNCSPNVLAFEQFSGRIRFRHEKAVMIINDVAMKEKASNADIAYYVQKKIKRATLQAEKLQKKKMDAVRADYIDSGANNDISENMSLDGIFTPQLMCDVVYDSICAYERHLVYDKGAFEKYYQERYPSIKVTAIDFNYDNIANLGKAQKIISAQTAFDVKQGIVNFTKNCNTDTQKEIKKLHDTLNLCGRASATDGIDNVINIYQIIRDIADGNIKSKNVDKNTIKNHAADTPLMVSNIATAAISDQKSDINKIITSAINASFTLLSNDKIGNYVIAYANKHHRGALDADKLADDIMHLYGALSLNDMSRIRKMLVFVFNSDKFTAILKLIAVCNDYNFKWDKLCKIAEVYTVYEIQQIIFAYEMAMFSINSKLINADCTNSGLFYSSVFAAQTYRKCYPDEEIGDDCTPDAWVGKYISIEKAKIIVDEIRTNFEKHGLSAGQDDYKMSLSVIRAFCAVFVTKQIARKDGKIVYEIKYRRDQVSTKIDRIIHCTFSRIYTADATKNISIFSDKKNPDVYGDTTVDIARDENIITTQNGYQAREINDSTTGYHRYYTFLVKPGITGDKKLLGYYRSDSLGYVMSDNLDDNKLVYTLLDNTKTITAQGSYIRYTVNNTGYDYIKQHNINDWMQLMQIYSRGEIKIKYSLIEQDMSPVFKQAA